MIRVRDRGIVDCQMGIGVEAESARRARLLPALRDPESRRTCRQRPAFPWRELGPDASASEQIAATLLDMDGHGIERAMIAVDDDRPLARSALERWPDRFFASYECDPHRGMDEVRRIERMHRDFDIRAVLATPAETSPAIPVDDRRWYPILAKCAELGLPFCPELGVPPARVPFASQKLEALDAVAFDFPELEFVMRGGCEPWTRLATWLMRRWPNLSFMTSGPPARWPGDVVAFANAGGADRIVYAGDAPVRLPLERSFKELAEVGFGPEVWPKVLRENAIRLFRLA